jgi:hypothetical protein
VARARYAARGFDAAAITVFVEVAGEVAEPAEGQRAREAALRFERPYAVVAVAPADGSAEPVSRDAFRWHGMPVFSAWVAEPSDASDGSPLRWS